MKLGISVYQDVNFLNVAAPLGSRADSPWHWRQSCETATRLIYKISATDRTEGNMDLLGVRGRAAAGKGRPTRRPCSNEALVGIRQLFGEISGDRCRLPSTSALSFPISG